MFEIKKNWHDLFPNPENKSKILKIDQYIARYNIAHEESPITKEILLDTIKSQKVNNEIKIFFNSLDKYGSVSLEGFQPETQETRLKIYELMDLDTEMIDTINKIAPLPPKINFEKTLTTLAKSNRESEDWLNNVESEYYWWSTYKDFLKNDLPEDVASEVITSLDVSTNHILNYLHPPHHEKPYKSKGLVIGYVQSGKTSNMMALSTKAIDVGYKIVIILSGTNKILRAQTQRRFDKQILGKEIIQPAYVSNPDYEPSHDDEYFDDDDYGEFISHQNLRENGRVVIKRITTSRGNGLITRKGVSSINFRNNFGGRINSVENLNTNDAYFASIMKNPAGIKKLKDEIIESGVDLNDIPILVIDDESDSASPNVASRKKDIDNVSRTNEEIRSLLKELPRAQYVAYTATPYANVFVSPNNEDDIFPKDFITTLAPSPGYMGSRDFQDPKYVRDIWIQGGDYNLETLQQAVDSFVLSGALKLYRINNGGLSKKLSKHHTMLVHESSANMDHEEMARIIQREIWDKADYEAGKGVDRLKELFEDDFRPHSKSLEFSESQAQNQPSSFNELKPFIVEAIDRIRTGGTVYKIVNQAWEDPDFSKESIWKILIGGNKISRGYTIEGLTISYYTRPTTAGDTLQQMARWFGYRKGYKDLVRLYIGRNVGNKERDLFREFQDIYNMDIELRRRISLFSDHKKNAYEKDATPDYYGPLVRLFGDLNPTRKSAMQDVELNYDNFGSQNPSKELFPAPKHRKEIEENLNLLVNFTNGKDLNKVKFSYKDNSYSENYLTFFASYEKFLNDFFMKFKMNPEKVNSWNYVQRFLKETEGKNNIDKWLFMIANKESTLLKGPSDKLSFNLHGHDIKIVKRTRKANGGFVGSVREDRIFSEDLAHSSSLKADNKSDLAEYREKTEILRDGERVKNTGIVLLYLANFLPKLEHFPSVWFSLFLPKNELDTNPVFFPKEVPNRDIPNAID